MREEEEEKDEEEEEEEEDGVNSHMHLALDLPSETCPDKATPSPSPKPREEVLSSSPRRAMRVAMGLTAAAVAWALVSTGQDPPCLNKFCHGRVRELTAVKGSADGLGGEGGVSTTSSRGRVAVCFFGIGRSLRWTLPSIERRLLGVLRDEGFEVDIFVHTYRLLEVSVPRDTIMGDHS